MRDTINKILYYVYNSDRLTTVCAFTVTYFEHNRAGITLYGFMLDRSYLHTIFGMELALVLWLLGKTIASIA